MKRIIVLLLSVLFLFGTAFCVDAVNSNYSHDVTDEENKYGFCDHDVIAVSTEEATHKIIDGSLEINVEYFKPYNAGIIKVDCITPYDRMPGLKCIFYSLTLDRHDCENVLSVVDKLKGDDNFQFIEPDFLFHLVDPDPAPNPMKVTSKTKTVKFKKLKKAKQTVAPITVKKAKGKVIYKKLSGSKKLSLKSNGKIVVKKGSKKGTYTAKIKVTAKGNSTYKSASKTVKVKVKVR